MRYFRTGFGKRKVKIINATLASDELSGLYTLTLENGKITGRERQDFYKKAADGDVNAGECLVTHGFVDVQVNGFGGVTFTDGPSERTLSVMEQAAIRNGTTRFCPTLVTCDEQKLRNAITATERYMTRSGSAVAGIHLEGPFISREKCGIHNSDYIRPLTDDTLEFILRHHSAVAMVTASPEMMTDRQMAELNRAGITLSLGHSALAYEQVVRKLDAFRTATHLFNGMRGLEGARSPGGVGAILDDHAIMAGIIPDLHHVSPALIRTAARLMPGRLYAVTDALCPAGNCGKPERFMFCDKELHIADGFCADDAGTLGGSVITMKDAMQNLVNIGIRAADAVKMTNEIPARCIRLGGYSAVPKEGECGDLLILRRDGSMTVIRNEKIIAEN